MDLVSKKIKTEHQSQDLHSPCSHHSPLCMWDLACSGKWYTQAGGIQPPLPTPHPLYLLTIVYFQQYSLRSLQDRLPPKISPCQVLSLVWSCPLLTPRCPALYLEKMLRWPTQNLAQDVEPGWGTDSRTSLLQGALLEPWMACTHHENNFGSLCLVSQCLGHAGLVGKSQLDWSKMNTITNCSSSHYF